jgi:RHS repeat-associated protein
MKPGLFRRQPNGVRAPGGGSGWRPGVIGLAAVAILALVLPDPASAAALPAAAAPAAAPAAKAAPKRDCPASVADAAAAAVTARLCRTRVQITDATTETDLSYANPDGTRTLEHNYQPVRVRSNGTWVKADSTLVRRSDGTIAPKAATVELSLSNGGSTHLLTVAAKGHKVSLASPLGKKLPKPTLSGSTATYAEVLPGVDLRVIADVSGYAEQLVVKNATAAANPALATLAFPITVSHAALSTNATGQLQITDPATGKAVLASSTPRIWTAAEDELESGAASASAAPAPASVAKTASTDAAKRAPRQDSMPVSLSQGTVRIKPSQAILTSPDTTFPVIIDPGITESKLNWTWVDSGEPTSAYWNSTDDARSGTADSGADVRRSFFQMNMASLGGAHIDSASFNINEVWAWSCVAEPVDLWEVGGISSATTWNKQPTWMVKQSTVSTAKGWSTAGEGGSSTCPSGGVSFNATAAVREVAARSGANLTLGLRSPNETNNLYWKRFSNNPTLSVTYNTPPVAPTKLAVTPSVGGYSSSLQGTLSAAVTSPDGAPLAVQFEVWNADYTNDVCYYHPTTPNVASGSTASWVMNTARDNGVLYHVRARSYDGISYSPWTGYVDFITDATAPAAAPTVSSADYPEGAWANGAGQEGSFTLGAHGITDVSSYRYGLDQNPPTSSLAADSLGGTATVALTPSAAGPHTLYVQSLDRAGNVSAVTSYAFFAGTAAVTSPNAGDIVATTTSLQGAAPTGTTGVTFQWRRADTDAWASIPTTDVTVAAGGGAVSWPVVAASGTYPKLNWNVKATLAGSNSGSALSGPLQTRAVFSGGSGGTSPAVPFTFDLDRATAATRTVGPGDVNLLTGALTVSHADAQTGSTGVTRTYNTRQAGVIDPMFGPGWVSSVSVSDGAGQYTALTKSGSLVQIGLAAGGTVGFTTHTSDSTGATFTSQVGWESLTLVYSAAKDAFTLTDTDGTVSTFSHLTGAPATSYSPSAVTVAGAAQSSTVSWRTATVGGATLIQPTRVLAPVPSGVSCTTLVRGCSALSFGYATATTADSGTLGDYAGRASSASYTAWDPDASPAAMRTVVVASYLYDSAGRLRQQWDPRQDWTDASGLHHAVQAYSYGSDGVLNTLTPAGEQPWQLGYTTVPGDSGAGRLATVSRSALTAGTATSSVVYAVPVSGSSAPYDLSVAQTARWGQSEAPVSATAIFDAGQVPAAAADQSSGTLPSSWTRATVTYLDANARETNTAKPGGELDATWYNMWGSVIRTLDAKARQTALAASGSDTPATEAALAGTETTLSVYSADGQNLTDVFEPTHSVQLANGTTVGGRDHTHSTYDAGAPATGGPFGLVTKEVSTVTWWDSNGTQHDDDPQTKTTDYDWTLRQPISTTVDPSGLALTSRTGYDAASGQVISETTPAGGTATTTPHTLLTTYYTAAANSTTPECGGRPEWDGQLCQTRPGGQAASGPAIPAKTYTYGFFGQPRTVVEKTSAGVQRTTTTTYDAAGRTSTVAVTVAAGLGSAITTRTVYDPATSRALRTQTLDGSGAVSAEIVRVYDTLGRLTSYTDADGNTTTTSYDLLSRPSMTNDGTGTRTYSYDGGSEARGLATSVTDSQGGTFTAEYDANGNLTRQTWPNGIEVKTGYDEQNTQTSISYAQPGCGLADCTLFAQTAVTTGHSQLKSESSTLSAQQFGYDAAGRLTTVSDSSDGQCDTRTYAFNSASDRTGLTEYPAAADGGCQSGTGGSSTTWTYDTADRSTTSGYAYDALGRAGTVPASDLQNGDNGSEVVSYFANDLAATLTQAGTSTTYTLDPNGKRYRTAVSAGVTQTDHYSDDSDSPVWTSAGGVTSRTITGIGGVAGSWSGSDGLSWQLTDLQGSLVAGVGATSVGLLYTSPYNEYGEAGNAGDVASRRYGWLGSSSRAADSPGGLVLMGARLYVPGTGSFTSVDPVTSGSANAYGYCSGDPVNCADTDGQDQNCKKVLWMRLCSVVVNVGWRRVRVARDRCSHWSATPCHGHYAWLQPWHSSRGIWKDTDAYRTYGRWHAVWDGETAYVYLGLLAWS